MDVHIFQLKVRFIVKNQNLQFRARSEINSQNWRSGLGNRQNSGHKIYTHQITC